MRKIFLRIFFLLTVCWWAFQFRPITMQIPGSTPANDITIRMPLRDKKRLDFFFREACFVGVWAYTLMGSKPVSFEMYTKQSSVFKNTFRLSYIRDLLHDCFWPPDFRELCFRLNPTQLKMKLGWETLNKYFPRFSNSRFVLSSSDSGSVLCLTLIDKVKFNNMVQKHAEDFEPLLQKQGDLLDNENFISFLQASCQNHYLAGILLGFGKENARLYAEQDKTYPEGYTLSSPWPEEQAANLDMLNENDRSFTPWDLSILFYPRFACDPLSEATKQLKRTYEAEREQIIAYYKGKDVVEATLSLLNQ